jgi:hypothetical protein
MPLISSIFSTLERLGSKPRDLSSFTRANEMWRLTSAGRPITVTYSGTDVVYTPGLITRERIQRSAETGALKVHVKIGRTVPVAAALLEYRTFPMVLGIHRYQDDPTAQPVLQAYGDVSGVTLNEGWVELDLVSAEALFSQPLPRLVFSPTCQLATYGFRCGVDETLFSHDTTIVSIERSTVVVDSIATHSVEDLDPITGDPLGTFHDEPVADGYYDGGQIKMGDTRERVFVASSTGTEFHIFGGLPTGILVGDAITLIAGDDRSLKTCHDKFNNVPNFIGWPDLPVTDPMQTGFPT